MSPSTLIATISASMNGRKATALLRIAEALKNNNELVTILAEQTIQDVDPAEIHAGIASMRIRGLTIPYLGMSVERRAPANSIPSREDIMAGDACIISYQTIGGDRATLTIVGRNAGRDMKIAAAAEAMDVASTSSLNRGADLLVSLNTGDVCEAVDACCINIDDNGVYLGMGDRVSWDAISAINVQETLSIAIGRSRLITVSES